MSSIHTVPSASTVAHPDSVRPLVCRPGAVLAGTGSYVPPRILANDEFPATLQTSDEWIRTRTGIRERRVAAPDENSFTLGLEAARDALDNAGLSPGDIDLIVCATVTPHTMVPSNACRLQAALGCRAIPAFDLSGACTGFLHGLAVASQFLATGSCEHVLVIGTETLSRVLDYTDRTSCILFGDGAGAAVLSQSGENRRGLRWMKLFSDGNGGDLIHMPGHVTHRSCPLDEGEPDQGSPFVRINGREVFKFAVRTLISLVRAAMQECNLPDSDRLFLVPHQVNQRILDAALESLPISPRQVVVNLDRYGNTSAASVPIALDEALRSGRLHEGDHLLLAAFGGGLTWGGAVITL